jgi:hypothetical protein
MQGTVAFKSKDKNVLAHYFIDAPTRTALVELAEERVKSMPECIGTWGLFDENGHRIKAGMFSSGEWNTEESSSGGTQNGINVVRKDHDACK